MDTQTDPYAGLRELVRSWQDGEATDTPTEHLDAIVSEITTLSILNTQTEPIDSDTQTEPSRPRPKPGNEIRADELDGLAPIAIEHPDTGELFTVAKVGWHGDTVLLTDFEGSETDIDRDSAVMVVAACAVCEHEIAEDYGLCPGCLHNAKRSGWSPGDPMSDFTGGA